jgi:hypothetical protein
MEETMALEFSICEVRWERYRRVSENPQAREWLKFQATRGLAANTIEAYGRDLDSYLGFLESENIRFDSVVRPTIGAYVRSIAELPVPRARKKGATARTTLAHATLQQHLTVVRLFHDFLVEERICARNPLRPAVAGRSFMHSLLSGRYRIGLTSSGSVIEAGSRPASKQPITMGKPTWRRSERHCRRSIRPCGKASGEVET